MAEACVLSDQDQFSCAVCLDHLKDPVTTPCGHNFCKVCINGCWDQEDQKKIYSCPQCKETFDPRPVLCSNNMLAEVMEKLKTVKLQDASPAQCYAGPRDVECDSCTGKKHKAFKSCLVCLASFCEDHLKPHYQSPAFKKHKLVEACAELQEKICSQHDKLMEIYCRTDQSFICHLCMMDEHKGHDTVTAEAERTEKQSFLSPCVSPGCDDSPSFTVIENLSFAGERKFLSKLNKRTKETYEREINKIVLHDFYHLTLDPNTVHPQLILSDYNRVVTHVKENQQYSDHPERFDFYFQVLCKERVWGRCYWEVELSGEVDISVSYKEIDRKGKTMMCWFGYSSQSWSLQCSSSSVSFWHGNNKTELRGPASSRIGVYVNHSAGTLSFYSVSDTMRLLHRVQTTFTQPLYAGFWLGSDSSVSLCEPKFDVHQSDELSASSDNEDEEEEEEEEEEDYI